eukprot:15077-Chlamydomonas_euryale.AAC.5
MHASVRVRERVRTATQHGSPLGGGARPSPAQTSTFQARITAGMRPVALGQRADRFGGGGGGAACSSCQPHPVSGAAARPKHVGRCSGYNFAEAGSKRVPGVRRNRRVDKMEGAWHRVSRERAFAC